MLDLSVIKEIVNEYTKDHTEFSLYDVSWVKDFGYNILQILVDKKSGINSDELGVINEFISQKLDKYESDLPQNYMLEVSSPGAEKPLRNVDEVIEAVGEKIHVRTDKEEYEGKLLSFVDNILLISINVKGRIKKVSVDYSCVLEIRLAV